MDGQAALPLINTESLDASGQDAAYRVLPRGIWRLFSAVWLFFLIFPITGLLHLHPPVGRLLVSLIGMVIIVTVYLWLMVRRPFPGVALTPSATGLRLALLTLLTACVFFLSLTQGPDWYWYFVYAGLAAGVALPAHRAMWMIVGVMVVAAGVGGAVDWLQMGRIVLLVAAGGFGMIGVGHLIRTIRELRAARAEIARLAVSEERLRFARDLHDLLGHSLSTIAIKTALAHRLLPDAPARAMRELDDVQTVTQEALKEVRDAVMGYRQPTLATELANAREILAAAGIACVVDAGVRGSEFEVRCPTANPEPRTFSLPTAIESVMAWTVREGVTNIVRHSRARHVTIRIRQEDDAICADITDDGEGGGIQKSPELSSIGRGSGLHGLAERAAATGGTMDAHACPTGGFRLAVTLPINKGLRIEEG
ncbi:MAG: sensor histidine kinase [Thermomicrobia bacterium]|nr:sensor histidine kinase [Thermomicrobia bacterium]